MTSSVNSHIVNIVTLDLTTITLLLSHHMISLLTINAVNLAIMWERSPLCGCDHVQGTRPETPLENPGYAPAPLATSEMTKICESGSSVREFGAHLKNVKPPAFFS